ncbi:hypothetical protein KQX54_015262 [Cotesia glomerata]|uniref:Uncharacterized protein n=1 Tax=Cotesia glomerata TaxID=32391 RepID=A0AAV7I3L2_COTGL|nr:hypothetical protein KQX54_015262 [Cotesia glomerata]
MPAITRSQTGKLRRDDPRPFGSCDHWIRGGPLNCRYGYRSSRAEEYTPIFRMDRISLESKILPAARGVIKSSKAPIDRLSSTHLRNRRGAAGGFCYSMHTEYLLLPEHAERVAQFIVSTNLPGDDV